MNAYFRLAPVTTFVLAINVLIFVGFHLGLMPLSLMLASPGVIGPQTFLAHVSHIDLLHILMNMAIFAQIGPILERQLGGSLYALCLILILALTAFLGQPFLTGYTLGFSGVVMGLLVLGAGVMSHYRAFSQQLLVLVGVNLITGLLPGISFLMHLTGAIAGGIVFVLLRFTGRTR